MNIFIDVSTGIAQRADGSPLPPFRFYEGDVLPINITYVDGGSIVTSSLLADMAVQRIGLKPLGAGGDLLAGVSSFEIVGNAAAAILRFDSDELATYLAEVIPTHMRSAKMLFEIEVAAEDGSTRQTLHQSIATVTRQVIAAGDLDPSATIPGGTLTTGAGDTVTTGAGDTDVTGG